MMKSLSARDRTIEFVEYLGVAGAAVMRVPQNLTTSLPEYPEFTGQNFRNPHACLITCHLPHFIWGGSARLYKYSITGPQAPSPRQREGPTHAEAAHNA